MALFGDKRNRPMGHDNVSSLGGLCFEALVQQERLHPFDETSGLVVRLRFEGIMIECSWMAR